jgi:hypothetical protein
MSKAKDSEHGTRGEVAAAVTAPATKHTPGPWEVDKRDVVFHFGVYQEVGPVVVFAGDQRVATCETYTAADEDMPNARLIAAAPALLAALTDMVCLHSCGLYGPIPEGWSPQTRQVIIEARAAIAKATGQEVDK